MFIRHKISVTMATSARRLCYFGGFENALCGSLGNLGSGLRATTGVGDRPEERT